MEIPLTGVLAMPGKVISRLAAVREEWQKKTGQKLTWEKLAEDTGIAYSTISRWANGKTNRYDDKVMAILCDYFQVQPGDILVYESDKD
jgi:DNA-binding Xre family transcriptional regulator